MKLLFEKSVQGRHCTVLPNCDVPITQPGIKYARQKELKLPELSESDISRHFSALERRSFGVNNGFYPLGSCTMKYNPKLNEAVAVLPDFTDIHPLQPEYSVQGALEVLITAENYLCAVTGMDLMTFQPAAGAHGELAGLMMIKKYHQSRGDAGRNVMLVPDSAHGTNPATAAMCGMKVVSVPSDAQGCVDIEKLKAATGKDTAGIMLTNPNTLGIFERNISEITKIIHDAGGLAYYDGANLNAIIGIMRPGDMGFDCVHLNLHKTFSTPHGGGGPGSGSVGCKAFLEPFMPNTYSTTHSESIGKVKAFYGNFLVIVKAFAYLLTLGKEGMIDAAKNAVLNANYLKHRLSECYTTAYNGMCMHEFVLTLEREAKEHRVTAMDIAKALLDEGIHPPTMYFPLSVHEALMVEPTETESKETLDAAADIFLSVYKRAMKDPDSVKAAPLKTCIRRPDELRAARTPHIQYYAEAANEK